MGEVVTIRSHRVLRATRRPIGNDDLFYEWACKYVAPDGAEIAYLHDRARIFNPDGTIRDVVGGQIPVNWFEVLR